MLTSVILLLVLTGSAATFTPINLWDISLNPTGEAAEIRIPASHNTLLFVRQGRVQVEDNGMGVNLYPEEIISASHCC